MNEITNRQIDPSCGSLASLAQQVESEFRQRFAREPHVIAAAPGRVNMIGEHIDYNDGFVLPMAIERYVVIAAAPSEDATQRYATAYSTELDEAVRVSIGNTEGPTFDDWGCYVEGVVSGFTQREINVPPFDAVVGSNVPRGGGLSSSAALEVASATMLEALTGRTLGLIDKAKLCQRAEHLFAGVPCGIMDQYSSVFGQRNHLMLIDCRSDQSELVSFDADDVSVLITNTNVKHELSGGEYAQRRSECDRALEKLGYESWRDVTLDNVMEASGMLSNEENQRARHVVTEIQRTRDAATAFRDGDWNAVGDLMYASHHSLRDDFQVSCPELDLLVQYAEDLGQDQGVFGSRMTGGGFGGCTVTLVDNDHLTSVTETMAAKYERATGIRPSSFASRPARGAHLLRDFGDPSHSSQ